MGGKSEKSARKALKRVRLKTWQLLLILIPLVFITATLFRFDHIKMVELKEAVLAADEAENDEELATALSDLKNFTFSHIIINVVEDNGIQNITFGTGVFYLEHQYIRAATAALEEAEQKLASDEKPNGNVFAKANEVCRPQAIANGWTWDNPNYLNCMTGEINKYPTTSELETTIVASIPSTELYRHNYASPLWAPTLSGFALLACLIISVVIFIRFLIWLVLRLAIIFLKNH